MSGAEKADVSDDGMTWTVEKGEKTKFNGFYFITGQGNPRLDPTAFAFEVLEKDGWRTVGASTRHVKHGA
eukprot:1406798-Rhodomonas_salina.2